MMGCNPYNGYFLDDKNFIADTDEFYNSRKLLVRNAWDRRTASILAKGNYISPVTSESMNNPGVWNRHASIYDGNIYNRIRDWNTDVWNIVLSYLFDSENWRCEDDDSYSDYTWDTGSEEEESSRNSDTINSDDDYFFMKDDEYFDSLPLNYEEDFW
eukprot:CAMPEP_0182439054 /NCGR_PEP_ID=MMETSP1167-20130531/86189_1 /TAXON_ID=2988 /ORGANISM="Mallomonas Sp, Strain CCMP3275" /LENGTH=156 /DNA_ID=CAMNT_0024632641 /DNA_START=1173 /DNA_END=1643 /DNA_ORIENTATION=+